MRDGGQISVPTASRFDWSSLVMDSLDMAVMLIRISFRIEDGPPRLDVVVKALAVADTNWKAKRDKTKGGKMKTLFGKVAGQ